MKQMGARNAGNPHVACDVEGAGDVERSRYRPTGAPVLDPTCAGGAQWCASLRDNGCSVRSTMFGSDF
jgi:hypothetical protein